MSADGEYGGAADAAGGPDAGGSELDSGGHSYRPDSGNAGDLQRSEVATFDPGAFYDGLPGSVEVTAESRPIFDEYAKALHEAGVGSDAFHAGLAWHQSYVAKQFAEIQEMDRADAKEALNLMRSEYGPQCEETIDAVRRLLGRLPPALEYGLSSARDAEGRAVLNDPATLRYLVGLARGSRSSPSPAKSFPSEEPSPTAGGKFDAEIRSIESKMGTNAYIRDEAMQARYRELIRLRGNTAIA